MSTRSPGIEYFVPAATRPIGTVISNEHNRPLFTPLRIKNMIIPHRLAMSPMAMYATEPRGASLGCANPYHLLHYGAVAERACSLIVAEATAISEEGRCSPEELGMFDDAQAESWKPVVDFIHSQGGNIGIQLSHGGRKASTWALHETAKPLTAIGREAGGWADQPDKIVSSSAISFSEEEGYPIPAELTIPQIKTLIQKYKDSSRRALDIAGFDFVEIQAAHGYLVNCFLSGASNKRTDEYGGSLENRMRFLLEIVDAVKDDTHPLFVRISAEEWNDDPAGWTMDETFHLADALIDHGVSLLDVSSGGISSKQQKRDHYPGYHVPLSRQVKEHVGDRVLVSTVGRINTSELANQIVEDGHADLIFVGSPFLKRPSLAWDWAEELDVKVQVSRPIGWPLGIV